MGLRQRVAKLEKTRPHESVRVVVNWDENPPPVPAGTRVVVWDSSEDVPHLDGEREAKGPALDQ